MVNFTDEMFYEMNIDFSNNYFTDTIVDEQANCADFMNCQEIDIINPELLNLATAEMEFKKENLSNKFLSMPFGTVIFANRYRTDREKAFFKGSHIRGPYIVVGRNDKSLICLKGTSRKPKLNVFLYDTLLENNNESGFIPTKNTYFSTSELFFLEENRKVSVIGNLDDEYIKMLARKMSIAKLRKCYNKYNEPMQLDIPEIVLDVGNIIFKDYQLYFIFNITDNDIEAFRVFSDNVNDNKILINRKYYCLDFDIQIIFPKCDKDLFIYDLVSKSQYYLILQKMKKHFISKNIKDMNVSENKKLPIERGSVINCQENFYYVYGEEGDEFKAFKIITQEKENYKKIEIDKNIFYTVFNKEIVIPKKEASYYEVILKARDIEMDLIKKSKKAYKKTIKAKAPAKKTVQNFPYIVPGAIIETNTLARERYLILDRKKNIVIQISLDNIFNDNHRIEELVVEHVKRVGRIPKQDLEQIISWVNNENQVIDNKVKNKIKSL